MKKILHSLFVILALTASVLTGCASKAVKHEVIDVRSEPDSMTATVVQRESDLEKINPRAYHFFVNGVILSQTGEYDAAADYYTKALQYYPNSYEIRFSLAETYYTLRRFHDVVSVLGVIWPEDEPIWSMRASSYMALGIADSARIAYRALVDLNGSNTVAYSYLASLYRQENIIDSLIWAYENLARLIPENPHYWREIGRVEVERGDYPAAKEAFSKAVVLTSDDTNILSFVGLAEIYLMEGKSDSALEVYARASRLAPDNLLVNRELSVLYIQTDSLIKALSHAKKVVQLSPADRAAQRRLGVIYYGVDSLAQADSVFTRLTAGGQDHPIDRFYLGRIAITQEDYDRAVEQFKRLAALEDTVVESYLDLGYAHQLKGDTSAQIDAYRTGLRRVATAEDSLRLQFSLGVVYEQSGRVDSAIAVFEEIIARQPDHDEALNYLGYMLADRGRQLPYARDLIERAVTIEPDNAAYLDSYGWVYFRLGDFTNALTYLTKAVSLDSDPTIYDHLGDTYNAMGESDKAKNWWQKALDLAPDNETIKDKLSH